MHDRAIRTRRTLGVSLLLLTLVGCLKREETITVHEDGSVSVEIRIAGNGPDIDGGAARMPRPEVYRIDRSTRARKHGDGRQHVLTATAEFPSVAAMPRTHAKAGAPYADNALTFDNALRIRREGERTVYTFVRRYEPRRWGRYRTHRQAIFTDEIQDAMDGDLTEKPPPVRKKVVRAVLAYERAKTREWVGQALEATPGLGPTAAAEARVVVGAAVDRHFEKELTADRVVDLLDLPEEKLKRRASAVRKRLTALVVRVASDHLGLTDRAKDAFREAYRSARHEYEVTTDLGDEKFKVQIRMPGEVRYDNGQRRDDGTVVWEFSGKELRDCEQTLVAVSAVRNE